ncbi:MAG TPA: hypothetical protein VF771_14370 [Longimicrobiaceae bacterium]
MRYAFIVWFGCTTAAAGCTSWHAQSSPAPEVVARMNGGGAVRVQRHDHSWLVLRGPRVEGDSIIGMAGSPPGRTAVAVADVERIDARRVSATKMGGLAAGTILLLIAAAGIAAAAAFADSFGA